MRNFRQRIKLQQFRNHQARPHLLLLVRVEIHHRQGHREQQLTSVERVRVRERESSTRMSCCVGVMLPTRLLGSMLPIASMLLTAWQHENVEQKQKL